MQDLTITLVVAICAGALLALAFMFRPPPVLVNGNGGRFAVHQAAPVDYGEISISRVATGGITSYRWACPLCDRRLSGKRANQVHADAQDHLFAAHPGEEAHAAQPEHEGPP